MARGVTLKGEAARAFIEGMTGKSLKTGKRIDADIKLEAIAVRVSFEVKSGTKAGMAAAKLLLKCLVEDGLEHAYRYAKL